MTMKAPQKLLIMGDSYSTFEGYIPEGFAPYYTKADIKQVGITDVEQTWWRRLCREYDVELLRNDSWSGSTVCYTAYNSRDCSADSSFIKRLRDLIAEGFFSEDGPDTVIVFGGTNDSWADAPIGELMTDGVTEADLFSVLPAFCHLSKTISELPGVKQTLFVINTGLKPAITEGIKAAAALYGAESVALTEVDRINGHPGIKGMEDIFLGVKQIMSN